MTAPKSHDAPPALDRQRVLAGLDRDPRYARAVAVLPQMVAFFSLASEERGPSSLAMRERHAAAFRDWIEDGKPMVTA
jgi:hypothetical protein